MNSTATAMLSAAPAQPSLHQPHTLVFFLLAVVSLAVAVSAVFTSWDIGRQRQFYWGGTAAAALCAFLASLPNLETGVVLVLFAFFAMTLPAYFSGRLIKIGGRVIAFHIQDSGPDPAPGEVAESVANEEADGESNSYGGTVTAAKGWWLNVFGVGLLASTVFRGAEGSDKPWLVWVSAAALIVMAVMFAVGDASWGYRVARGQYLQFGLAVLISAGVFGVFYLLAFVIAKRRPYRNKNSSEYGAHSRHQRK